MKWIEPEGKNVDFGPPANWDQERDGTCGTLPLRRVKERGGYFYHYSAWKPTSDELAQLNAGGVIELCCVGVQPPVSIDVVANPAPESPLERRQRRFGEFKKRVFSILRAALAEDMERSRFDQTEAAIRLAISPDVEEEMLCYTDEIKIRVTGSQWTTRHGWLWLKKRQHRHINAFIVFEPYSMSLASWTDPECEGQIISFE